MSSRNADHLTREEYWREWVEHCTAFKCGEDAREAFSKFASRRYRKYLAPILDEGGKLAIAQGTLVGDEIEEMLDESRRSAGVSGAWIDFETWGWRKADEMDAAAVVVEQARRDFKDAFKEKVGMRCTSQGHEQVAALELEATLQIRTRTTNLRREAIRESSLTVRPDVQEGEDEEHDHLENTAAPEGPAVEFAPEENATFVHLAATIREEVEKKFGENMMKIIFSGTTLNEDAQLALLKLKKSQAYARKAEARAMLDRLLAEKAPNTDYRDTIVCLIADHYDPDWRQNFPE